METHNLKNFNVFFGKTAQQDEFISTAIFKIRDNKVYGKNNLYESIQHTLNNIGLSLMYTFIGMDVNLLHKIEADNSIAFLVDAKAYGTNIDYLCNQLEFSEMGTNKLFYLLKFETNYFFDKLLHLFKNPQTTTAFRHSLFENYANFMARYFIVVKLLKKLESHILISDASIAKKMYPLYCDSDIDLYKLCFFKPERKALDKDIYLTEIFRKRRKNLEKNINKYHYYNFLDFAPFIYDSYYTLGRQFLYCLQHTIGNDFTKKDLKLFEKINYIKPELTVNPIQDFLYYDCLNYFFEKYDKEKYFEEIARFIGVAHFTKKFLINNYPKYSFNILKVQKDYLGENK